MSPFPENRSISIHEKSKLRGRGGGGGRVMEEAGIGDTGESYIVAYRHIIIIHREWQHKSVVRA